VGIRDLFNGRSVALFAEAVTTPAPLPPDPSSVPPMFTFGRPVPGGNLGRIITSDADSVHRSIALSIPAVRKARQVIAGTIATFALSAWQGRNRLEDNDPRATWIGQPDPTRTLLKTMYATIDDGIWYDRAVWRILDRDISGMPVKFRHIQANRISTVADTWDPDDITTWIIDGKDVAARDLVVFDFAGMGGLKRWGMDLLELYVDLQMAAGKYARSPHPKAIIKNSGGDLGSTEIMDLLDAWEAARELRSVGYMNAVTDYETFGWNAAELQLVEAREHAALEVARLFGLPARAVDASSGDSMTYANIVEARRDILEALHPWMEVVQQTLSLNNRASNPRGLIVPRGISIRFDVDAYVRDEPLTRMQTWQTALAAGVLSPAEVRVLEPLAPTAIPPAAPPPATTSSDVVPVSQEVTP
jgi:HK97 family phage portal protein